MSRYDHNIWKIVLCTLAVLFFLGASSALAVDVLFVVGKKELRPGDLAIKNLDRFAQRFAHFSRNLPARDISVLNFAMSQFRSYVRNHGYSAISA